MKIFDFSQRLPGPYASYLLAQEGLKVTKVEFTDKPDPFKDEQMKKLDPIFSIWYEKINSNKELIEFKSIKDIHSLHIKDCDAIFCPPNFTKYFSHLKCKLFVLAGGSGKMKYMHDLNALAQLDSFAMSNDKLPFLPFAGIIYGNRIALRVLKELALPSGEKVHHLYLDQMAQSALSCFFQKDLEGLHLHNGKFPCYQLYKTKDRSIVAVAAVEEKFWEKLCELLELDVTKLDRYDTTGRVYDILKQKFSSFEKKELQKILKQQDICVNFVS